MSTVDKKDQEKAPTPERISGEVEDLV